MKKFDKFLFFVLIIIIIIIGIMLCTDNYNESHLKESTNNQTNINYNLENQTTGKSENNNQVVEEKTNETANTKNIETKELFSDYYDKAEELMKTMNASGMISSMKHFPGYGNNVDTHTGIAIDERPYSVFETSDFSTQKKQVVNAVKSGRISEETINVAVRRILAMKYAYSII